MEFRSIVARICIGGAAFLLVAVPLMMLWRLSDQMKYFYLKDFYGRAMKEGIDLFPSLSKWFLPFAPIGLWSYLTPVFLGAFVGLNASSSITWSKALGLLAGALLIGGASIAAFVPFVKMVAVMGVPAERFSTPLEIGCNVGLVGVSALLFALAVRSRLMRRHPSVSLSR